MISDAANAGCGHDKHQPEYDVPGKRVQKYYTVPDHMLSDHPESVFSLTHHKIQN
jgi:hypothetical protein